MWGIVLLLGLWTAADPVRVGIIVLLLSRRQPMANLLAYWLGGMAAGVGFSVAALILLRDFLPVLLHDVTSSAADLTGGYTKIVIGVLALLIAALNAVGLVRRWAWVPMGSGDPLALVPWPSMASAVSRVVARVRDVLGGGHPWIAFMAGFGLGPPPVEYLAVLSVIVASGAAIGTQLCAAVVFTVVMFAIAEIPLVVYLVKPALTETIVISVNNWLRTHRRRVLIAAAGVLGIFMVTSGLSSI